MLLPGNDFVVFDHWLMSISRSALHLSTASVSHFLIAAELGNSAPADTIHQNPDHAEKKAGIEGLFVPDLRGRYVNLGSQGSDVGRGQNIR